MNFTVRSKPISKYLSVTIIGTAGLLALPCTTSAQNKSPTESSPPTKAQYRKQSSEEWNLPDVVEVSASDRSKIKYREVKDALPIRKTEYMIRVPDNWNGTLLNDLDYYNKADSHMSITLLEKGYALSGTRRRPDRSR